MNDDVLAVAISPDAKHIAVALLDSTVKVCIFVCVLIIAYLNCLSFSSLNLCHIIEKMLL